MTRTCHSCIKRKMRFYEKLHAGWWWFGQVFQEWLWTMTHESPTCEFFDYINMDYIKYEEDIYYEIKDGKKITTK